MRVRCYGNQSLRESRMSFRATPRMRSIQAHGPVPVLPGLLVADATHGAALLCHQHDAMPRQTRDRRGGGGEMEVPPQL